VQEEREVEARGPQRQRDGAADHEAHAIRHPAHAGERACGFNEMGRQVHAGHAAAVTDRDHPRRAADARTDVEGYPKNRPHRCHVLPFSGSDT
jgi:hypothetical protein